MTIEGLDVTVNGTTRRIPEATTVALLATTLIGPVHSGIAIAVNGTVLPMASWAEQVLHDGDRIDVIMAQQGG